jgi:hypothetical protein
MRITKEHPTKQMVSYWLGRMQNEGMISVEYIAKKSLAGSKNGATEGKIGGKTDFETSSGTDCYIAFLTEMPDYRTILGIRITITNYESYQISTEANSDASPKGNKTENRTGRRTGAETENHTDNATGDEIFNKKEQGERRKKNKNSPPKSPQEEDESFSPPLATSEKNPITAAQIFEIWEREKGAMPSVAVRQPGDIRNLIEYFNSFVDDKSPQEHWIEIIHKARQCHPSHRRLVSPAFFSKDLEHINQLLRGVYDHSFERKGNGKPTVIERKGRGDAEEFGATEGNGVERAKKLANAFKSSDV